MITESGSNYYILNLLKSRFFSLLPSIAEIYFSTYFEVWIVLEPDLIQLGFMGERLKYISKLTRTNNLYTIINKSHPYVELKNLRHQLQKFEQYLDPEPLTIIPFSVEFLKGGTFNPFAYLDKTAKEILIQSFLPLIKRMVKEAIAKLLTRNDDPALL